MKKVIMIAVAATALAAATPVNAQNSAADNKNNPFFQEWKTPYGVPPFNEIKPEHYLPAIEEGMLLEKAEIDAIINNPAAPTFENTIVAYDNTGEFLAKVSSVFGCITGTDITPELEEIQAKVSRLSTAHRSDISLNDKLFARIKNVYDQRNNLGLDPVQMRLLEKIYKGFERNGADLSQADKEKLRKIDEQLSKLSLDFGRNLRKDNGEFFVLVTDVKDLKGLPKSSIDAAREEAKARGKAQGYAFTLDKPSMLPFLQYADNRELRKQLYTGYLERCNHNNATDNKAVINQIINLKLERAKLMGFPNPAAFIVENNMAKNTDAIYELLGELWTPALKRAAEEEAQMKAIMNKEGIAGDIQQWDWWYYSEKLREAKYALNEEELRPYFELNATLQGLLDLTSKMWGLQYKDITAQVPTYNSENKVFEVREKDGSLVGVVYWDFHPRSSKRVGAWCTRFRGQSYKNGEKITPIVSIVCNFTKASGDTPALLSLDEVGTLFHEYGHGLHSLFADNKYKGVSGVERDFVEFPSKIMENWALEPEMLRSYAKHYKTGEVITDDMIAKIQNAALFNQGFETVEYLMASLLDMDYHTVAENGKIDVAAFENRSFARWNNPAAIAPRYRSTYFQHIFSGGYSAGYYVYIWAEVLAADGYAAFAETGDIYNPEVAKKLREEILSRGGSADGMTLYRNYRGKEASKQPLMESRGLL
ncbi:Dipeptidyl carboxypeptidase Dcp [Mucinivorans hirudinis]|uniref:Dipeptidyl carboxypeptidase Dcp n=1 Tax=Mucinivorans hirudinis TaxID=1433126 RepID=A0A060RCT8_9BACT|nr:Dipeptidyl carboxypeptidase Dcp [Mucinivorans hirudinis]